MMMTMSQINYCPECGKALAEKALRCGCGWRKPNTQSLQPVDHRCQYTFANRRCPLTGTMSNSIFGSGNWYCTRHWQTLDNPPLAEAALREIEENYYKIVSERKDWRESMHDEFFKKVGKVKQ